MARLFQRGWVNDMVTSIAFSHGLTAPLHVCIYKYKHIANVYANRCIYACMCVKAGEQRYLCGYAGVHACLSAPVHASIVHASAISADEKKTNPFYTIKGICNHSFWINDVNMNMNNLYQLKAMLWTVFSIFSLYDVTIIMSFQAKKYIFQSWWTEGLPQGPE